jgi:hypothetical protein
LANIPGPFVEGAGRPEWPLTPRDIAIKLVESFLVSIMNTVSGLEHFWNGQLRPKFEESRAMHESKRSADFESSADRFKFEKEVIDGVRYADGTKVRQPSRIGFRPTNVVSKPKRPESRTPAQDRYDAEMRSDEQSKRAALARRAKRIQYVLRTARAEGRTEARAMGLGGEVTKFKLADFDRIMRACQAFIDPVVNEGGVSTSIDTGATPSSIEARSADNCAT